MLHLISSNDNIILNLLIDGSIHYTIGYTDFKPTEPGFPKSVKGILTTNGNNTVISGHNEGSRLIQYITLFNNSSSNVVKLVHNQSSSNVTVTKLVIDPQQTIILNNSYLVNNPPSTIEEDVWDQIDW